MTWNTSPDFVGLDYFCDSEYQTVEGVDVRDESDPLWDGVGCGPQPATLLLQAPELYHI